MSATWDWPGSRWWRVDLHAHSPASYDFEPDAERAARNWDAWVSAAVAAGLDAVAVTDHNSPNGIEGIQQAAAGKLVVFPGVEVTVGGIHLLCLFDPARRRDDVVSLLAQLGISKDYERSATASTRSIADAIEIARDAGALVVAAHGNGPKGLLTLESGDRKRTLQHSGLAAVELADGPAVTRGRTWLDPTGDEVARWLDGANGTGRKLTRTWGSDSHGHADVGREFTWVKMTRPDLAGLGLALLDGEGSVKRGTSMADPNVHADSVIESVTVAGAKYVGRGGAGQLPVRLNPWLNAIIGGRGTGKSTLVDLCRMALRREDELPGSKDPPDGRGDTIRGSFDRRMSVASNRSDEGLLTDETLVEVTYRKDGERFRVAWAKDATTPAIWRMDGDGSGPEAGLVRDRFPVRIYSQKQLFELAKEPQALTAVIDDTPEVRGAASCRAEGEAAARYLSLRAQARELRGKAAELPARQAELADVRRKLEVLQERGHADGLLEYRRRHQQEQTWNAIIESTYDALADVRSSAERLTVPELDLGSAVDTSPATAALVRGHRDMQANIAALRATVLREVDQARSKVDDFRHGDAVDPFHDAVRASALRHETITKALSAAGISNPEEYRNLLQLAARLDQQIGALADGEALARAHEDEAEAELRRYRAARSDLTARRATFAARASGSMIRVTIGAYADRDELPHFVRETLRIQRFESDVAELAGAASPSPEEGWDFGKLDQVVARLRALRADATSAWPAKDARFDAALRRLPPERVDRLALYLPEDGVDVTFRDPRHGGWTRITQGSPGQQTAALLAFVLGYGTEPIILDQPEDDLDNTLIYELLVQRLRAIKAERQVIVVTHNPNIVVHGDAELVLSLATANGQTQVKFAGGLQEPAARDEVCRVMEGGRAAFASRYRRIMHGEERRDD